MSLALSCAGVFGGPAHSASAMSAVAPLPFVAQFACGLVLVDFPPQSFAESNKRIQVSQLERDSRQYVGRRRRRYRSRQVYRLLDAAMHNASENAAPERWFRQRRRGDFDAGDTVATSASLAVMAGSGGKSRSSRGHEGSLRPCEDHACGSCFTSRAIPGSTLVRPWRLRAEHRSQGRSRRSPRSF